MPEVAASIPVTLDFSSVPPQFAQLMNRLESSAKLKLQVDSAGLGSISRDLSQLDRSLAASNARVIAFGTTTGVLFGVAEAFRGLVRTTIEVEKELTNIQSILHTSNQNFGILKSSLFDIAGATATSFKQVADVAANFARQGLGMNETLKRTRDALILARETGVDAKEAFSSLTAAVNTFSTQALDSTTIINKLVAVSTSFAVTSADLAEGIKRAGATAQQSKVTFDQLVGAIAAIQTATGRGGAAIGTSLQRIFARIDSGPTLKALSEVGVRTREINGEIRPAVAILEDLADKYKTLTETQRNTVAQALAGRVQFNQLNALLKDYARQNSIAAAATQTSNNATNEAIRRNEELNTTLSALINKTKESGAALVSAFGEKTVGPALRSLFTKVNESFDALRGQAGKDSIGQKIGAGILDGIATTLKGPGAVLIGFLLLSVFSKVGGAVVQAVGQFAGLNKEAQQQKVLQDAINRAIAEGGTAYARRIAAATSLQEKEQLVLSLIESQNIQLRIQAAQSATLAERFATRGATTVGALGKERIELNQGYIPNAGNGLLSALLREKDAVGRGVGGASSSAHPVVLPNFSFGGGKVGPVVANSNEFMIRNFAGSGGSAVFNPQMISRFGGLTNLSRLGHVERIASQGLIPNYALGDLFRSFGKKDFDQWSGMRPREIREMMDDFGIRGKRGSSRYYYPLSKELGVKVAFNEAGLAQNQAEESILGDPFGRKEYGRFLPELHHGDPKGKFNVVESLGGIATDRDLLKSFGVTRDDYSQFIEHLQRRKKPGIFGVLPYQGRMSEDLQKKLESFIANYNLKAGDLNFNQLRLGKGGPKFSDLGLTDSVFNDYYNTSFADRNLGPILSEGYIPSLADTPPLPFIEELMRTYRNLSQNQREARGRYAINVAKQLGVYKRGDTGFESLRKIRAQAEKNASAAPIEQPPFALEQETYQGPPAAQPPEQLEFPFGGGNFNAGREELLRNPAYLETKGSLEKAAIAQFFRQEKRRSSFASLTTPLGQGRPLTYQGRLNQFLGTSGQAGLTQAGQEALNEEQTLRRGERRARFQSAAFLGALVAPPLIEGLTSAAGINPQSQAGRTVAGVAGGLSTGVSIAALAPGPFGLALGGITAGFLSLKAVLDNSVKSFEEISKTIDEGNNKRREEVSSIGAFAQSFGSLVELQGSGDPHARQRAFQQASQFLFQAPENLRPQLAQLLGTPTQGNLEKVLDIQTQRQLQAATQQQAGDALKRLIFSQENTNATTSGFPGLELNPGRILGAEWVKNFFPGAQAIGPQIEFNSFDIGGLAGNARVNANAFGPQEGTGFAQALQRERFNLVRGSPSGLTRAALAIPTLGLSEAGVGLSRLFGRGGPITTAEEFRRQTPLRGPEDIKKDIEGLKGISIPGNLLKETNFEDLINQVRAPGANAKGILGEFLKKAGVDPEQIKQQIANLPENRATGTALDQAVAEVTTFFASKADFKKLAQQSEDSATKYSKAFQDFLNVSDDILKDVAHRFNLQALKDSGRRNLGLKAAEGLLQISSPFLTPRATENFRFANENQGIQNSQIDAANKSIAGLIGKFDISQEALNSPAVQKTLAGAAINISQKPESALQEFQNIGKAIFEDGAAQNADKIKSKFEDAAKEFARQYEEQNQDFVNKYAEANQDHVLKLTQIQYDQARNFLGGDFKKLGQFDFTNQQSGARALQQLLGFGRVPEYPQGRLLKNIQGNETTAYPLLEQTGAYQRGGRLSDSLRYGSNWPIDYNDPTRATDLRYQSQRTRQAQNAALITTGGEQLQQLGILDNEPRLRQKYADIAAHGAEAAANNFLNQLEKTYSDAGQFDEVLAIRRQRNRVVPASGVQAAEEFKTGQVSVTDRLETFRKYNDTLNTAGLKGLQPVQANTSALLKSTASTDQLKASLDKLIQVEAEYAANKTAANKGENQSPSLLTRPEGQARGWIPNFNAFMRETMDIRAGVGGARSSDYPMTANVRGLGNVIVNSGETIARNWMGTGKDAVLNRKMRAALGFIPNYANEEPYHNPLADFEERLEEYKKTHSEGQPGRSSIFPTTGSNTVPTITDKIFNQAVNAGKTYLEGDARNQGYRDQTQREFAAQGGDLAQEAINAGRIVLPDPSIKPLTKADLDRQEERSFQALKGKDNYIQYQGGYRVYRPDLTSKEATTQKELLNRGYNQSLGGLRTYYPKMSKEELQKYDKLLKEKSYIQRQGGLRNYYSTGYIPSFADVLPSDFIHSDQHWDLFNAHVQGSGRLETGGLENSGGLGRIYAKHSIFKNRRHLSNEAFGWKAEALREAQAYGKWGGLYHLASGYPEVNDAVLRESSALKKRGVTNPNSYIRTGESQGIFGVYNTIDEPDGISQGIGRYIRAGLNPRNAGKVPNYAVKDDIIEGTMKRLAEAITKLESAFSKNKGTTTTNVEHKGKFNVDVNVAGTNATGTGSTVPQVQKEIQESIKVFKTDLDRRLAALEKKNGIMTQPPNAQTQRSSGSTTV